MELKYQTTRDEQFLTIEDIARRTENLEVNYIGEEGTVIEGSEEDFRKVIEVIESQREDLWNQMTGGVSNQKATQLDDKRIELKYARNRLRDALDNPNHRWRT